MGSTDVEITKQNNPGGGTSEAILDALAGDPDVQKVDGRYEAGVLAATGSARKRAAAIGLRRPQDKNSDFLRITSGAWFETASGNVAVIDQAMAEGLKLKVGSEFVLPSTTGGTGAEASVEQATQPSEPEAAAAATSQPALPDGLRLKAVGIVHKPALL